MDVGTIISICGCIGTWLNAAIAFITFIRNKKN